VRAGGLCRAIKMMQVRSRFFNRTSKARMRDAAIPPLGGGPSNNQCRMLDSADFRPRRTKIM
jgi:hypothetical protein